MPRRAALVQLAAGACWLAAGGVAQASSGPAVPSELAGELAEARLQGKTLPATTIIPSVLITKDNAKDFYHPDSPF